MSTAADVRQWAREYYGPDQIGARGHLGEKVVERYNDLHPDDRYTSKNPSTTRTFHEPF